MTAVAKEFDKIIKDARERKKNEALASKIFKSQDRRQSAPSKLKSAPGGSLASRVGVKKVEFALLPTIVSVSRAAGYFWQPWSNCRTTQLTMHFLLQQRAAPVDNRRSSVPAGNVNGEWTHDLHGTVNGDHEPRGGSLGSRITVPGSRRPAASQRKSRLATAVDRMEVDPAVQKQVNVVKPQSSSGGPMGLTIRGLAGPFTVMAQNFAPGTSAADIESAMTPIGGEIISCKFIKTSPIIIVELIFASREGGERVIETFNDKTADGRIIKVYQKIGGGRSSPAAAASPLNPPTGPRSSRNNPDRPANGSNGAADLTATNNAGDPTNGRLYSDRIVAGNRRGRGFQRGRGAR
ncbi:RNA-binding protein [Paramyrothecium foliicola]|nr:RNA-binding protein [Paramyrothecium foliicola]